MAIKQELDRELTKKREAATMYRLQRNSEGSKILLDLFHLGYKNAGDVLGLLILYYPEDDTVQRKTIFKEFWLGQFRSDIMLAKLRDCLEKVKEVRGLDVEFEKI